MKSYILFLLLKIFFLNPRVLKFKGPKIII